MTFKKGFSGNPSGKPKGITARGLFRQQVESALPGIVEGLIALAQEGDVAAARLILDKVLPNLKPQAEPVRLTMPQGASLTEQGAKVLAAAASGKLATDDAQAVMSLLSAQSKLVEQGEVMQRLEAVEAWLAEKRT